MIISSTKLRKHSGGFSLIELMIAMVLGVVIVGGSISIFTGIVQSSSLNQTVSNLQANARFVLDHLGREVRAAGFMGCAAQRDVELFISTDSAPTSNLIQTAITGALIEATQWSPAMPAGFTPPTTVGAPVVGTHALSVQYSQYPGVALRESMQVPSSSIALRSQLPIRTVAGDLLLISDCSSADLFEVDAVSGNATKPNMVPTQALNKVYRVSTIYPENTRAMRFISNIYYIGNTQRTTTRGDAIYGLYMQTFPYDTTNPPVELLDGIDQLQLEFGIRQANGNLIFVAPESDEYSAAAVETLRIGILMSSYKRFSSVDETRVFTLAGRDIEPISAATTGAGYPADNRMRIPFNAMINVRNRNL